MNHGRPALTTGTPLWSVDTIETVFKAMAWKAGGLEGRRPWQQVR